MTDFYDMFSFLDSWSAILYAWSNSCEGQACWMGKTKSYSLIDSKYKIFTYDFSLKSWVRFVCEVYRYLNKQICDKEIYGGHWDEMVGFFTNYIKRM